MTCLVNCMLFYILRKTKLAIFLILLCLSCIERAISLKISDRQLIQTQPLFHDSSSTLTSSLPKFPSKKQRVIYFLYLNHHDGLKG